METVETWGDQLEKLGGSNTAYWPNQPVKIPKNVNYANYINLQKRVKVCQMKIGHQRDQKWP